MPIFFATWKVEIQRITVRGQAGQKEFMSPHLNQWLGVAAYVCHPSYTGKHKKEYHGTRWPRHRARPYLKNNQYRKGWGVAQVTKCLPRKYKTLSSTSILPKEQNKATTIKLKDLETQEKISETVGHTEHQKHDP
jgi:hypothetical protein